MALNRDKGILARVTALSILVSYLVSLASMRMTVQAQRPHSRECGPAEHLDAGTSAAKERSAGRED